MKLTFDFDIETKKIVFYGNGFKISAPAETYEDIADFAKSVTENDIGIPGIKHREEEYENLFAQKKLEDKNLKRMVMKN